MHNTMDTMQYVLHDRLNANMDMNTNANINMNTNANSLKWKIMDRLRASKPLGKTVASVTSKNSM